MEAFFDQPLILLAYFGAAMGLSFFISQRWAQAVFAVVNMAAIFKLFYFSGSHPERHYYFLTYLCLVLVQLGLFYFGARRGPRVRFIATISPIVILIIVRLMPLANLADYSVWFGSWSVPLMARSGLLETEALVGFSYVAFRLSLLGMELNSGAVMLPSMWRYLGYVFFVPTMIVGPISPARYFAERLDGAVVRTSGTIFQALLRIIVGLTKFLFISAQVYQLTFARTFVPGEGLSTAQFLAGLIAYPLYIYTNFSGFCDVMVGTSALLGFQCKENFDRPFLAAGLRDFWKRWHMSLTEYLQAMIFNPFLKWGAGRFGTKSLLHLAPLGTFFVFGAMGLWHGFKWNYTIFSLIHAMGLTIQHYWRAAIWPRWGLYLPFNVPLRASRMASWALTLGFVTISFFFFENSIERIQQILTALGQTLR